MYTFLRHASRIDNKGRLANYVVNFNGTVFAGPFNTIAESQAAADTLNAKKAVRS